MAKGLGRAQRKITGLLLAVGLLGRVAVGCSHPSPPGPDAKEATRPTAAPTTGAAPSPIASGVASVAPPPSSVGAPAAPAGVAITELAPTQGDLTPLLVAQIDRAKAKGLVPLVEFYADWCPGCRAFQKHLEDPRMQAALRGTFLVKLNLDDWHDKLPGTGFDVHTIPSFYQIGADGRPTGKWLDGDKWKKPTPESMSASLAAFLGRG